MPTARQPPAAENAAGASGRRSAVDEENSMSEQELSRVIRSNSAWSAEQVGQFLQAQRIPLRLACSTADGTPMVCSLWYLYQDGALWCATQQSARVVSYLEDHPQCGFEVAPESMPYRGVRGQGRASISPARGLAVLEQLVDRYLGGRESDFAHWLLARGDREVAIRIAPAWLTSWDFAPRMARAAAP
jgi:nitroimidazol reductase NimA-like FMN-containing flavoprotein (pyridoxamine 5'-phosphate oxidase superfamily)